MDDVYEVVNKPVVSSGKRVCKKHQKLLQTAKNHNLVAIQELNIVHKDMYTQTSITALAQARAQIGGSAQQNPIHTQTQSCSRQIQLIDTGVQTKRNNNTSNKIKCCQPNQVKDSSATGGDNSFWTK